MTSLFLSETVETPKPETTFVRTYKLDALIDAVATASFYAPPHVAAILADALDRFDGPHIPDVDLVPTEIENRVYSRSIRDPKDYRIITGWEDYTLRVKAFYTERQKRINDSNTTSMCFTEMHPNFCERVEPEGHFKDPVTPHWWTVTPEKIATAARYEDWCFFDFTDYGGPVLGWPTDERPDLFYIHWLEVPQYDFRWHYGDRTNPPQDEEHPAVMLKIYEWLREQGAREPSFWLAEEIERKRNQQFGV